MNTTPTPTYRVEKCGNLYVYHPVKEQPATFYTTWAEYTASCA